jgi:hypothetical protein
MLWLLRLCGIGILIYGVAAWDSLEVELRYEDCPEDSWAVCMCVNGQCHSLGDLHTRSVSLVAGTIVYSFTTIYDLSEYAKVTWNGHVCHGRTFTSVVSHECWRKPGFLETISYDISACKAVLISYRDEPCNLLQNLSIVGGLTPNLFHELYDEQVFFSSLTPCYNL